MEPHYSCGSGEIASHPPTHPLNNNCCQRKTRTQVSYRISSRTKIKTQRRGNFWNRSALNGLAHSKQLAWKIMLIRVERIPSPSHGDPGPCETAKIVCSIEIFHCFPPHPTPPTTHPWMNEHCAKSAGFCIIILSYIKRSFAVQTNDIQVDP